MADYWVSQAKHHCDFCKCWIADNKPSRDYHEKGKKHQQNVQAKISQIHKKSRENAKKEEELSSYFREMEENALKAAKRDLTNDPTLAGMYGVKVKEKEETEEVIEKEIEKSVEEGPQLPTEADINALENWDEDKSPEGYTYYWNTLTGESRWVPPTGYIPKAERGEKENSESQQSTAEESDKTEHLPEEKSMPDELEQQQGTKRKHEEDSTSCIIEDISAIPLPGTISIPSSPQLPQDEVLLESKNNSDSENSESEDKSEPKFGPAPKPRVTAYSKWEKIEEPVPEEPVDLQLPVSDNVVVEKVMTIKAEPKIKFREKIVPSLAKDNAPVFFKKKKKGIGYKNLKQRTDDL